jgi:hypothetical protein
MRKTGWEKTLRDELGGMQGRVRSFPHEKNNWASFVYIDVSDIDLDDVRNFLVKVKTIRRVQDVFIVPGSVLYSQEDVSLRIIM